MTHAETVLRNALWWAKNSGKSAEELIEMKWVHEAEGLFKEGVLNLDDIKGD